MQNKKKMTENPCKSQFHYIRKSWVRGGGYKLHGCVVMMTLESLNIKPPDQMC